MDEGLIECNLLMGSNYSTIIIFPQEKNRVVECKMQVSKMET